jgi:ArsR family transcriptional regulator, arsenate/arsenite/antimonite-responsive transcriptional repressor
MEKTVEQLKALGEPNRFRIMMMLRERPLCVCEIHSVLNISGSTLSNHLKTLKYAGLAGHRRDGKWVEYYLKDESVRLLLNQIADHMENAHQINTDTELLRNTDRTVCSTQNL